ncbi:DUF4192 domain-containing protein [Actinosynnema sp. NPDC047251]|uniref:DUF4192 domain-containing protein n=1 Tax=Saccharothrix espanaensis (strain ATCC 51144 / DSM 44229 / JCM 9112 / NBRC 15066 / NRRL 15764) TaxID=1179773 RepID=K0JWW7_SACES|nr:DUF4192 domain-containing protein [Saccharothrix espanaensis]CCH29279.1 hypothetical protein BN6_19600 [Saccharothrix espanaensis DSM 44229]
MTDDQTVPVEHDEHAAAPEQIPLTDPGDMIAALPHLLGFYPADSLILLGLDGDRIRVTLRVDLVEVRHDRRLADQLAADLSRQNPTAVVGVVVGDDLDLDGVGSRTRLAAHLAVEFAVHGVHTHFYGVPRVAAGERWFAYDDPSRTGQVPDPSGSLMHALTVSRGLAVQPSREALAATLEPDTDEALARRAGLIGDLLKAGVGSPQDMEAAFQKVRAQVERAVDRVEPLTDAEIVELGVALSDPWARDWCLALAIDPLAGAAERLWTELVRTLPAPECAHPASLLAIFAYIRGDGPLASLALDHALDADPDHRLSVLVNIALENGMPPETIRGLAERCVELRHATLAAKSGDDPASTHENTSSEEN